MRPRIHNGAKSPRTTVLINFITKEEKRIFKALLLQSKDDPAGLAGYCRKILQVWIDYNEIDRTNLVMSKPGEPAKTK